jgi:hypothetical protein
MRRRWDVRSLLTLSLAAVDCTALGRSTQRKQPQEDSLTAAAEVQPLRRWLDRPATKGTLLVLAGGMSGAIAKSATAPLERAKLMAQAGQTANFFRLMADVRARQCATLRSQRLTAGRRTRRRW